MKFLLATFSFFKKSMLGNYRTYVFISSMVTALTEQLCAEIEG